jgi:ribonuclease E
MKDNTATVRTQVPVDVATFLLNEKRADIQAIELRHKVNILLIPNVHLETPQHSIIRLRHDELNQDDLQQPSYKMVDIPTEDDSKQSSNGAEAKAPRQEAAIKGITPAQPAPIVAEKQKAETDNPSAGGKGFVETILSWFRSTPTPAPAPEPAKKPRSANPREGQRDGNRGGRNNRNNETREGREPRGNREQKEAREPRPGQGRDESTKQREPRETREPRRQRGEPRPDRKDLAAAVPAAEARTDLPPVVVSGITPGTPEQTTEEGSGGNARRRGRRGGRRERGEPRENQLTEQNGEIAPALVSTELIAEPAGESVAGHISNAASTGEVSLELSNDQSTVEISIAAEAPAMQAAVVETPVAAVETIVQENIAPVPAPVVVPVEERPEAAAPAESKAVEQKPVAAPVAVIDIDKALEQSGLVMVETSSDKAQSWQPEITASEAAPRPRRKRPAPAVVSDEPLMMVETHK